MPLAGKSEVRRILVEHYGFYALDTKVILRDMAARLTGLEATDFILQEDKAKLYHGVQRRKIMGEIGNAIEKLYGDNFLLKRSLEELNREKYERVVVDSLRKDQPRDFPGLVIEVISDKAIDTGNDFDLYDKSRINGMICNFGNFAELEASIKRALWI